MLIGRRKNIFTGFEFIFSLRFMEPTPSSSGAAICTIQPFLPVQSSDCYVPFGDFCVIYTSEVEKLVNLCQNHGVFLKQRTCPHCSYECRIEKDSMSFWKLQVNFTLLKGKHCSIQKIT